MEPGVIIQLPAYADKSAGKISFVLYVFEIRFVWTHGKVLLRIFQQHYVFISEIEQVYENVGVCPF